MEKTVRFETLEDMAQYVLSNTYNAGIKWELRDRTDWQYVDKEAGKAWEKERPPYLSWKEREAMTPTERAQREELVENHNALQPEQIQVTTWSLNEQTSGYHSAYIEITNELGLMLDGIWTKKQRYKWSSNIERVGALTIPGMLKRLGNTEISKKVDEAKKNAKLADEKRNRNNTRSYIEREAKKFMETLNNAKANHPEIDWPSDLEALCQMSLQNEL